MQRIDAQTTIDGLAAAAEKMDGDLEALIRAEQALPDILETMSRRHERLTRKVISLCEADMEKQGLGPPPVPYCWINMGSDARREQALRTDQDNALIYADPKGADIGEVDAWFEALAQKIVHGLDRCGFDLCTGNVMAVNPKWRRSASQWAAYIENWSRSLDPDDSIVMTILLDFRPVWGDDDLARMLWGNIFKAFENPEKINHMLTQEDLRFDIPVDIIGRIQTRKSGPDKDQVNLKSGGLVHLINGARIFAVNNRITETSTLGRITELEALGVFSNKQAGFFKTAFETLAMLRIRTNMDKISQNCEPDNCIDPSMLTREERTRLRNALFSASHMQKLIQNRFTQIALNFFS